MFSQIIDQKEHKNNWYKFEPATWCYKHHSTNQVPQPLLLTFMAVGEPDKVPPLWTGFGARLTLSASAMTLTFICSINLSEILFSV